jgi:hypothetical protein
LARTYLGRYGDSCVTEGVEIVSLHLDTQVGMMGYSMFANIIAIMAAEIVKVLGARNS